MNDYEHFRLNTLAEVDERRDELVTEARTLSESDLEGDDLARFTELTDELEALNKRRVSLDRMLKAAANPANLEAGAGDGPEVMTRTDPWAGDLTRARFEPDVKERATTAVERMEFGTDAQREAAADLIAGTDRTLAADFLVRSNPAYGRAFQKLVSDPTTGVATLTADEAEAVREVRAMSIGTDSAGGYMVPTHLDPQVIMSSAGSVNPFRQVCRVETLTEGNTWNGVTSTGVTASFDTEGAEVSDDTPVLANPQIPVHMARAFVPASIELLQDAEGIESELARLFADAKNELEVSKFSSGTGTNEPTGVVTALSGAANYTAMATNSAFAVGDLFTAIEALPARFRPNAAWQANLVHINDVMEFGGTSYYTRSGDLSSGPSGSILGKPVFENSSLGSTLSTATNENIIVADWRQCYTIVDRSGASVEVIPNLLGDSNRPTGVRGVFYHWRTGGASQNSTSGVLLYNPGA